MERKVMQLMKRGAITCHEDTNIREVAQIMVVNRVRYCVITNNQNEVQGIISSRSILKAFGNDLEKTSAKDILLPHTVTITTAHPLGDAIELMIKKKIEHLVVVSDRPGSKAVIGILRAADIVKNIANN